MPSVGWRILGPFTHPSPPYPVWRAREAVTSSPRTPVRDRSPSPRRDGLARRRPRGRRPRPRARGRRPRGRRAPRHLLLRGPAAHGPDQRRRVGPARRRGRGVRHRPVHPGPPRGRGRRPAGDAPLQHPGLHPEHRRARRGLRPRPQRPRPRPGPVRRRAHPLRRGRLQPGRRQVAQQPRRLRPDQRRRAHRLLQARLQHHRVHDRRRRQHRVRGRLLQERQRPAPPGPGRRRRLHRGHPGLDRLHQRGQRAGLRPARVARRHEGRRRRLLPGHQRLLRPGLRPGPARRHHRPAPAHPGQLPDPQRRTVRRHLRRRRRRQRLLRDRLLHVHQRGQYRGGLQGRLERPARLARAVPRRHLLRLPHRLRGLRHQPRPLLPDHRRLRRHQAPLGPPGLQGRPGPDQLARRHHRHPGHRRLLRLVGLQEPRHPRLVPQPGPGHLHRPVPGRLGRDRHPGLPPARR